MVEEFVIESNVPIPSPQFPFKQMKKGDSFFVPKETAPKAVNALASYKNHSYAKFQTRQVTEKGRSGIRIWRVK